MGSIQASIHSSRLRQESGSRLLLHAASQGRRKRRSPTMYPLPSKRAAAEGLSRPLPVAPRTKRSSFVLCGIKICTEEARTLCALMHCKEKAHFRTAAENAAIGSFGRGKRKQKAKRKMVLESLQIASRSEAKAMPCEAKRSGKEKCGALSPRKITPPAAAARAPFLLRLRRRVCRGSARCNAPAALPHRSRAAAPGGWKSASGSPP